jgi:hypothetical protein
MDDKREEIPRSVEKRKEEKNRSSRLQEKWRKNDVDAGLALSLACFPANLCIAAPAAAPACHRLGSF